MGSLTVTADRIVRQAANTIPGNATGAEAACQSLTPSQVRDFLGMGTADSPSFSGMTLTGNLLFSPHNTYDIGNGTYDPRTVRAATSVLTPLLNNTNAAALIVGNSTYGVTVPGAIAASGNVSVTKATTATLSATSGTRTAYVDAWQGDNVYFRSVGSGCWVGAHDANELVLYTDSTRRVTVSSTGAATFSGDISMQKATQGYIRAYGPGAIGRYTEMYHDDNRGYVTSNFGGLNLNPDGYVRVAEMAAVSSGGQIRIGYNYSTYVVVNGFINYGADVRIYSKTTTSHALGLMGLSGQTAALFECQDNGGSDIFTVEVTGASRNWSSGQTKYTQTIHDGTNGILSTSSGNLNLAPAGGTVAVTGGITASGNVYCPNGSNYIRINTTSDNLEFFRLGIVQGYIKADTAAAAINIAPGLTVTGTATVSGSVLAFGAGFRSAAAGNTGPVTQGTLDLWTNNGTGPCVLWTEGGVANRGALGFAAGSSTLSYRVGGTSMTTGTEVFTIGNTGNVTCAGITASGIFSLTANYQDLADGVNIVCGTTTGTKLATGATQKLSFWGVTPVVQPASANQAALSLDSDVTGGDTVDKGAVDANFAAIQTLVNQLRSDLVAAGIIKGAA